MMHYFIDISKGAYHLSYFVCCKVPYSIKMQFFISLLVFNISNLNLNVI